MEIVQPKLRFPEFRDNWKNKYFKEIYSFRSTNSLSRDRLNYENGLVKNIHYGDIHSKFNSLFKILNEQVPYINNDISLEKIPNENYLKEKDLVIADASEDYNDIGKCLEIIDLNDQDVLAGLHTFIARPDLHDMALGFGNYLMKSDYSKIQIKTIAQGTKVLSISTTRLSEIKLNIPSLEEQIKIANFLSSVDEKLNLLKEKKELLEDFKKGVMQKIFNQDIRFKDDNGNDFEDWEEKQIKNIFKVTRGTVLSMLKVKEHIQDNFIYPVYSSQTKQKGLAGYYSSYLFENAITWTTDGAGAGDVKYRQGKFYCTNVCGVLLNEDGYCNLFIAELLNSVSRKYVSYIGNPKLMNNVMADITIYIPSSIKEQNKISAFLSSIDEKIELVSNQILDTQEYKRGLLQQMFV